MLKCICKNFFIFMLMINPSYSFNNFNLFNRRSLLNNVLLANQYNNLNKFDNFKLQLNNNSQNKDYFIYSDYQEYLNKDLENQENQNQNKDLENLENQNKQLLKSQQKPRPRNNYNNNIYFTGHLTEETCFGLTEALLNHKNKILLNSETNGVINLYIQSPGGALMPTLALVDEIKNLQVPVYTYIRGYAASAATLLSVVGTKRFMYKHSIMMIHGLKFSGENSVDSLLAVKDLNDNTELFMKIIKSIYLENSNLTSEQLEYMFMHDKWFDSAHALEYGLIDEIL